MKTIYRYSVVIALVLFVFENSSTFAESSKVNYDTAWTFVYDGGKDSKGDPLRDVFYDVAALNDGSVLCVGKTGDSALSTMSFYARIDKNGRVVSKEIIRTDNATLLYNVHSAHSICQTRKGDFVVGGERFGSPYVFCIDTNGVEKWSAWLYDSTVTNLSGQILQRNATVNSLCETSRGTIICAAGDEFPNNGGSKLDNYTAFLELDSLGTLLNYGQSKNMVGYTSGGFSIDETSTGKYLIAGNKAVQYLDTNGAVIWKKKYTYMLEGVGSTENTVYNAKMLRDGTLMVVGQTYEGNCWTKYKTLYRDAWWSPISYSFGANSAWDTAGVQKGDDILYNFTQLIDGRIVFIGHKATVVDSGMWIVVTDSVGKEILWEGQYMLPGVDSEGNDLDNLLPLSVCATPDSGFTIVGDNNTYGNNHNAFVFHFIPVAPVKTNLPKVKVPAAPAVRYCQTGSEVQFTAAASYSTAVIVSVSGKLVAEIVRTGATLRWDCFRVASGVYQYRLQGNTKELSGTLVVR